MKIKERSTGAEKEVAIDLLREEELKGITKARYFFKWKDLWGVATIYKLTLLESGDILGLMALSEFAEESRLEIKLLAVSKENRGSSKVYEGIAGCLIAFACRQAVLKFGSLACVSLVPKTELKVHYMTTYGMMDAGWQVFLEGNALNDLIVNYLT